MEKHSRPAIWYLTTAASLFVGLAPIIVLEKCYVVPRKIMVGFGVLAWLIGVVAIKWPIYRFFIDKAVRRGANHRLVACIQGILSGVSELGIAAAFFILVVKDLTLPQLIGFGAGAGMVEATTVPFIRNPFRGTALEGRASDLISGAAGNPIVQWLEVLERVWATLLQVSSRALVYITVATGHVAPLVAAVLAFACVDGIVYYGLLEKWRFDKIPVLLYLHCYLCSAAIVLVSVFAFFSPLLRSG